MRKQLGRRALICYGRSICNPQILSHEEDVGSVAADGLLCYMAGSTRHPCFEQSLGVSRGACSRGTLDMPSWRHNIRW